MSSEDQLRIDLLELSSRVNSLAVEVIKGRTELAEKVDRMAEKISTLDGKVDSLHEKMVHLTAKVAGLDVRIGEILDGLSTVVGLLSK